MREDPPGDLAARVPEREPIANSRRRCVTSSATRLNSPRAASAKASAANSMNIQVVSRHGASARWIVDVELDLVERAKTDVANDSDDRASDQASTAPARIAFSWRCRDTRVSSRPETLAQAISSSTPTAIQSTRNAGRTGPNVIDERRDDSARSPAQTSRCRGVQSGFDEDEAGISFWDDLIVATAARSGAARVLSADLNSGQVI